MTKSNTNIIAQTEHSVHATRIQTLTLSSCTDLGRTKPGRIRSWLVTQYNVQLQQKTTKSQAVEVGLCKYRGIDNMRLDLHRPEPTFDSKQMYL